MKRFEYADTTFLFRNGEQQICIYDKIIEMQNKIKDFGVKRNSPSNVMRIENRLLKKRKIFSVSGVSKLYNLYHNYDFVKSYFRDEVGNNLFKYNPEEIKTLWGNSFEKVTDSFRSTNKRYWFNSMIQSFGLLHIIEQDSYENLVIIIKNMDLKKMQVSRYLKKLRDLKRNIDASIIPNINSRTNLELYNELKTKFYKAVA